MKRIYLFAAAVYLCSCNNNKEQPQVLAATNSEYNTAGKSIVVYTTADSASYRLTATDTLQFADFGQPMETQPCVFVDPSKTYQTFLGIGVALTDAAAETYAKLPAAKQEEFMNAYYNQRTGIGYTLARTNI